MRESDAWSLWKDLDGESETTVSIPADVAWRVWTKSMSPEEASEKVAVRGKQMARDLIVSFVAIMQ